MVIIVFFCFHIVSPQASSTISPPGLSTIPATIINMNPTLPGERHISFAVNKENDSNESGHTALVMNDDDSTIIVDGNSVTGNTDRRSRNSREMFFFPVRWMRFVF